VDRAAARLILRGEEEFDLFVGLVDGAEPSGLVVGLAAEAKSGFSEARLRRRHG
jgi:hypothetical protein